MKLIALNLVFLAIFVNIGFCSFSTFYDEYSLKNEDDYYNDYPADHPSTDQKVENIPLKDSRAQRPALNLTPKM